MLEFHTYIKLLHADAKFRSTKELNVKVAGDGTNIDKRLHVINFTFILLDEGSLAHSCDGNHTRPSSRKLRNTNIFVTPLRMFEVKLKHLK